MLTVIEKVILLQNVDLFREVPTEELSLLATIAEERSFLEGDIIFRENDAANALYLVIDGRVRLHQDTREIFVAGPRDPFGTWALFDDEPRVVTATVIADARLLRVDRRDFVDLLADNVQIAQSLIRTVARRLRALAGRVS